MLHSQVTVVDSDKFLEDYASGDRLQERKNFGAEKTDTRHVSQLLIDQVCVCTSFLCVREGCGGFGCESFCGLRVGSARTLRVGVVCECSCVCV